MHISKTAFNNIYYIKWKNQLHLRGNFAKQKLLQMIQVTVPNFFYFDEISKIRPLEPKNHHFCLFFSYKYVFLSSSGLIFEISSK